LGEVLLGKHSQGQGGGAGKPSAGKNPVQDKENRKDRRISGEDRASTGRRTSWYFCLKIVRSKTIGLFAQPVVNR
jgi:hypothetical protein